MISKEETITTIDIPPQSLQSLRAMVMIAVVILTVNNHVSRFSHALIPVRAIHVYWYTCIYTWHVCIMDNYTHGRFLFVNLPPMLRLRSHLCSNAMFSFRSPRVYPGMT